MDSQKIKILLVLVFAAFASLYLGIAAASAQTEAIAWVAGALALVVFLALGRNIWILIPASIPFSGQLNIIPGSPAPWWAATFVVLGFMMIRVLMRRHDLRVRFTWLEFAIFLQLVVVAQAFVRNPVGFAVLGGDVVGGKPYISFAMASVAFFLLSTIRTDLKMIKIVVIGMVGASFIDGGLMLASVYLPALAAATLPIYSGVSFHAATRGTTVGDISDYRLDGAQNIGSNMGTAALTLFRPLSTLNPFTPLRFIMITSSLVLIMLSGFRSVIGMLLIYAVISTILRKKYLDLIIGGAITLLTIVFLVITNTVQDLPFGVQRVLSVLPVDVRQGVRDDAEGSSEWRFEMWRLALTTDRYIHNKVLGDGFNYRADELAAQISASYGDHRAAVNFDSMDQFMAKGSYHGFHVEAIRMTGAVGLLAAIVGLCIFLRYAWLQVKHFRGRPEWGFILFLCIPYLIHPFYLLLIFGGYRTGFPDILVGAGILKILDNIRVNELAAARVEAQAPTEQTTFTPTLPRGSLPMPAMRSR